MNAWILSTRSATLRNEPRLIARWLSKPNHRSTWFNQDAVGGREVQMEAWPRRQPPLDLGVLVRRVVVQYQVDVQLHRHLPVDQTQERQELLVAVPLPALPEYLARWRCPARRTASSCRAGRRRGCSLRRSRAHRQRRLGAIERLNLRLLVHAQDHRVVGRVEVQPDDVAHLLDEERIGGQLEGLRQMRLDPEEGEPALYLKLPQFRGHLSSWRGGGVHDAEVETAVPGGIPTADG